MGKTGSDIGNEG